MKVLPVPVASVSRMRLLVRGDGLQHALDGDVLVVAALEVAALVLEGHGGEAVAPGVLLRRRCRFQSSSGVGIARHVRLRVPVCMSMP